MLCLSPFLSQAQTDTAGILNRIAASIKDYCLDTTAPPNNRITRKIIEFFCRCWCFLNGLCDSCTNNRSERNVQTNNKGLYPTVVGGPSATPSPQHQRRRNNSVTRDKYNLDKANNLEYQPEMIKADDFLNVIWLSNPQIDRTLDVNEISEIGLTSLISAGLTSSLPKLSIIQELDDNIHKYTQDGVLSDADVVRVATRITTKQLSDIDNLNKLAKENKELFVQRLNDEARKQKELENERIKKIDKVLSDFTTKSDSLNKLKNDFEEKSKALDEKIIAITGESAIKDQKIENLSKQLEDERKLRKDDERNRKAEKKEAYIDKEVRKWQRSTNKELTLWLVVFIAGLLWLLKLAGWNINNAITLFETLKANFIFSSLLLLAGGIFSGITFKKWYDKNHNYSNIENYKKGLKLPKEFHDEA
jgi:hypothetical protein